MEQAIDQQGSHTALLKLSVRSEQYHEVEVVLSVANAVLRICTYDSTVVPVYYVLADPANVSLRTSPADVADGCTMYQGIWIS
jgi:hypothetical protein